jgi:hypothetical protein
MNKPLNPQVLEGEVLPPADDPPGPPCALADGCDLYLARCGRQAVALVILMRRPYPDEHNEAVS